MITLWEAHRYSLNLTITGNGPLTGRSQVSNSSYYSSARADMSLSHEGGDPYAVRRRGSIDTRHGHQLTIPCVCSTYLFWNTCLDCDCVPKLGRKRKAIIHLYAVVGRSMQDMVIGGVEIRINTRDTRLKASTHAVTDSLTLVRCQ